MPQCVGDESIEFWQIHLITHGWTGSHQTVM